MKKRLVCILICGLVVGLSACGKKETQKETESLTEEIRTESGNDETLYTTEETGISTPDENLDIQDFSYTDLQGIEFWFGSGAGGWCTTMTIEDDGSFEGVYYDSDMGVSGDEYPNGTLYYCEFSGQLSELTKIDELTYSAEMVNISYKNTVGEEEYLDGFKYIYTDAYGLDDAETIYFYLPGTKRESLTEDCLSWIDMAMYDENYNPVDELTFVCLYNVNGTEAFSSYEKLESYIEPTHITIDLSTIKETHIEGDAVTPLELNILSEENNGISEADYWYDTEDLELPMIGDSWDCFYDESYMYRWTGDTLYIYEKDTENCLYALDYKTDKWYVNGNNAYLKDGIFYGASVANGYATPESCFMFAYDLENDKLLWRSADQSYNSMNFVVVGDVIICGYGFTAEDDYLYQINMNTGEIIDKILLKKMPDLIVEQDGKLYVHTYNYNYIIGIN